MKTNLGYCFRESPEKRCLMSPKSIHAKIDNCFLLSQMVEADGRGRTAKPDAMG